MGLDSLVWERRYRSPFLICLTMMFVLQFSGVNYVASYAVDIFQVVVSAATISKSEGEKWGFSN